MARRGGCRRCWPSTPGITGGAGAAAAVHHPILVTPARLSSAPTGATHRHVRRSRCLQPHALAGAQTGGAALPDRLPPTRLRQEPAEHHDFPRVGQDATGRSHPAPAEFPEEPVEPQVIRTASAQQKRQPPGHPNPAQDRSGVEASSGEFRPGWCATAKLPASADEKPPRDIGLIRVPEPAACSPGSRYPRAGQARPSATPGASGEDTTRPAPRHGSI